MKEAFFLMFGDFKKIITGSEELGILIKEHRKKYNVTQKELAQTLGVTALTIKRYESGGNMTLEKLAHLSKILKIELGIISKIANLSSRDQISLKTFYDLNKAVDEQETLKKYLFGLGYFAELKFKSSISGGEIAYWEIIQNNKEKFFLDGEDYIELNNKLKVYIKKFLNKNKINEEDIDMSLEKFEQTETILKIKDKIQKDELKGTLSLTEKEHIIWDRYQNALKMKEKDKENKKIKILK